ncbi:unnamed protein product, partial [Mesorhabditis belari]|uniref:F-box domain-containing protein n=1 Tax=Mesorhabditis belari TaxID=2138241 RepID=A0AAF3ERD1_9BILA
MDSSFMSDFETSSLHSLPIELLYGVLSRLDPKDLQVTRLVSRRLDTVISMHDKFLARPPFHVTIFVENGVAKISHNKLGHRTTIVQNFSNFDFKQWSRIEVSKLEIRDFETQEFDRNLFETLSKLLQELRKSRNFPPGLALNRLKVNSSYSEILKKLFDLLLPKTQNLLIDDCNLPVSLEKYFGKAENSLVHYRCLNSRSENDEESNSFVLKKFANDLSGGDSRKNFHFEVSGSSPSMICDFIQDWIKAENAAFFNIFLHGCNQVWRAEMGFELRLRGMEGHFMEFSSKTHANAHIKMVFDESSNMCRLWPIFDVPARTAGQLICYARFYRDF